MIKRMMMIAVSVIMLPFLQAADDNAYTESQPGNAQLVAREVRALKTEFDTVQDINTFATKVEEFRAQNLTRRAEDFDPNIKRDLDTLTAAIRRRAAGPRVLANPEVRRNIFAD